MADDDDDLEALPPEDREHAKQVERILSVRQALAKDAVCALFRTLGLDPDDKEGRKALTSDLRFLHNLRVATTSVGQRVWQTVAIAVVGSVLTFLATHWKP